MLFGILITPIILQILFPPVLLTSLTLLLILPHSSIYITITYAPPLSTTNKTILLPETHPLLYASYTLTKTTALTLQIIPTYYIWYPYYQSIHIYTH